MGKNKGILLVLMFFLGGEAFSQNNYFFLSFRDKGLKEEVSDFLSPKSLSRRHRQKIKVRESDYPVNHEYVSTLVSAGIRVEFPSKWLNGVLVSITDSSCLYQKEWSFIKDIRYVGSDVIDSKGKSALAQAQKMESVDYGNSLFQLESMGANKMHEDGFAGQGKYIAIFDGGFINANTLASVRNVYSSNRLKFTYNVVDDISDVYLRHTHGTNVFSCLSAYSPSNLIGMSYGADYALFITEDVKSEKLIEEYNWLRAAEMADSLGVDIISSSLGYYSFDNADENHTLDQLDGKKAVITLAAEMAARKGILVVNSAGNNYSDASWRKIVFPADGDSVLAVGAVDRNGTKASFSAIGPTVDGRIKPDVCAFGTGVVVNNDGNSFPSVSGTSYSAPLVAGLAAGLWQLDTTLTNIQLKNFLVQSCSQFCTPDNQIGYGIPNYVVASQLILGKMDIECKPNSIDYVFFPNPVEDVIIFQNDDKILLNGTDYSILDVNGKELAQGVIGAPAAVKIKIDISTLKAGVYFLRIGQKLYRVLKT